MYMYVCIHCTIYQCTTQLLKNNKYIECDVENKSQPKLYTCTCTIHINACCGPLSLISSEPSELLGLLASGGAEES